MLNGTQKIEAIAWESKKRGLSYGVLSTILTEESKRQIYLKYESYLVMKQKAEKERLRRHSKSKKKMGEEK
ncbi:MAG: hypothetical protein HFH64_10105 [Lachnospiraceae bacterium]|nr:hypothetical protein [Lachnospiraceae bacterium]